MNNKGEITLISYRKELVDNNNKKRKRSMRMQRIVFVFLMIASIQGFAIAAHYYCDHLFHRIDMSITKCVWFCLLALSSVLLFCFCLWLFIKNNPNDVIETKYEHLFYDDEKLLYSYAEKHETNGIRTEIEIPWDKITDAKYFDKIMGFVINGDFIKRRNKKEERIKTVVIYDYMWDLKLILFKHGVTAKGNVA